MQRDGGIWQWFWIFFRSRGPESVDIGKVKGHATDEMVKSGRVQKRDQIHNGISDQDATKGIEEHGEGIVALAKALANKHKAYTSFMARIHCVMIAAHRAAAQSRKAFEIADGKVERTMILVPKSLPQSLESGSTYLSVRPIPECFILTKEK